MQLGLGMGFEQKLLFCFPAPDGFRCRRIAAYTLALYVSSPLLATLTHNISDDTIAALSTILFLLHLFFQDYAYLAHSSQKFVQYYAQ